MPKKKQENIEIKDIAAPTTQLSPLFSNFIDVHSHPEIVVLDFAFIAPGYGEPYNIEATQIARICLPWPAIENLSESLSDAISHYHKKNTGKTGTKKSKR